VPIYGSAIGIGERFAVLIPPGATEPTDAQGHLTLVTNFFDELGRVAPVAQR